MKRSTFLLLVAAAMFFVPEVGFCSVETTLANIQTKLLTVIFPVVAILGLIFAGLSFVSGNPGARQHLVLAVFGAIIGFGAPSIVTFIRGFVQ